MQDNTKIFIIRLDGQDVAQVPIKSSTTVGNIKEYFKNYLKSQGKNPEFYTVKIYRDRTNKFDVDATSQYDNVAIAGVWSHLTQPLIVLDYSANYFKKLYTDTIYQIALRVPIKDLPNLCLADKSLSRICNDDKFWMSRVVQDFGNFDKPVDMTWKDFYRRVSIPDSNMLLFDSIEDDILELVIVAVARGADLKSETWINHRYYKPLRLASEKGHLEIVKYLVEQGANIHDVYDAALRLASDNGHLAVVKYLVENGANIHAQDDYSLKWASANGHLEVVKYLVERGANIHANGDIALIDASQYGHLDVVKYLVEKGANIYTNNYAALRWANDNGHLAVVKYLQSQMRI